MPAAALRPGPQPALPAVLRFPLDAFAFTSAHACPSGPVDAFRGVRLVPRPTLRLVPDPTPADDVQPVQPVADPPADFTAIVQRVSGQVWVPPTIVRAPTRATRAWRATRAVREWVSRAIDLTYLVLVIGFVATIVAVFLPSLRDAPLLGGYGACVTSYLLFRFVLSLWYRPVREAVDPPTVAVVIPCMNEAEGIGRTIDSIFALDYPRDRLSVVVVDDGSTDDTWEQVLEASRRHPNVCAMQFSRNRGKRAAMAAGMRASESEIICFVDSDSRLDADAMLEVVKPFADPRVGIVTGHADVANRDAGLLARLQQVRYYVAFRVVKGAESVFGAVTCASGCFSAYRRDRILEVLPRWERQTFLGQEATFGDDRALTNMVLAGGYRTVYQSTARCVTVVPDRLHGFLVQQTRWKKSWVRESLIALRFIWRRNPLVSLPVVCSVVFPLVAPLVVAHTLLVRSHGGIPPIMWLVGVYAMALVYALYYKVRTRSADWWTGIGFSVLYATVLLWQTYYAIVTLRRTLWGTRSAGTTDTSVPFHICDYVAGSGEPDDPDATVLRASAPGIVQSADSLRMRVTSALALPLSLLPFLAFGLYDPTGSMLALRATRAVVAPPAAVLTPIERTRASSGLLHYDDRVVVLAYPRIGDGHFTTQPRISVRQFASEVEVLHDAGAHPVSLEQLVAWRLHGAKLPRNAVLITFDGASEDLALNAAPVLRRHGYPATIFVRGGAYRESPVQNMSDRQVRRLVHDGWSIGAASSRPDMRIRASASESDPAMPYLSAVRWNGSRFEAPRSYAARASREFAAARSAAARLAGGPVSAFAYPYGAYGQRGYSNDASVQRANEGIVTSRFEVAFTMTTPERYRPLGARSGLVEVPRMVVRPWSTEAFMTHVADAASRSPIPPPARSGPQKER
ncbi:MAG: glycosyl transferase family 2 [Thermoleophilia bacterium]|nr:glycosyl transferase family 2 [Thermoleophilia bacterium]